MTDRRSILAGGAAALLSGPALAAPAKRPFQPSWDSLAAGYHAPDWFRDAKFGIWAHWGPQCQPEAGDWYGRIMYVQGERVYEDHIARYGHPSKTGFIDVIGRWKAEAWDPEALVDFYKESGARYFVAMANHHDNFDNYASSHQGWNSVRVGPRKDLIGGWARAARKAGLRFGVSNHSAHAWHWWQTAYGYDVTGPMKGVRYDAFRVRKADGPGTWWAGLDPQELYTGGHMVIPDGIDSLKAMRDWHGERDGKWLETPPPGDPRYARKWLARCNELVDRYQPDLLYFDNEGLPLLDAGLQATAHIYNASLARHGSVQAVVTGKKLDESQRRAVVYDVERGFSDRLLPEPWQTDTCLGDWHYNRARFEKHSYVPAKTVVQRLADIVSKNGNLLLSVPVRAEGTIDEDERRIVGEIGAWLKQNGAAIYGSRPWRVFGEGPTEVAGGQFGEAKAKSFTPADIRFTTNQGALHAIALDWPSDGVVRIASLARGGRLAGDVQAVELLGAGPVSFSQGESGLEARLPAAKLSATPLPVLRIRGSGLA